jgi:hypothetical protein
VKSVYTKDFAYLIGNFTADGSFYKDSSGFRFEFVDGSPYEAELKYSLEHILKIKKIVENFVEKQIGGIRKRGKRYVLSFRNKEMVKLFLNTFEFLPGDKSRIVDIPKQYAGGKFEKYFWMGYLDGDGSIARDSRRIAVESMSTKIIDSFAAYLNELGIYYSRYESKRENEKSQVLLIRSVSFRDFSEKIGFNHPLKSKLVKDKLKTRDFYNHNLVNDNLFGAQINYVQIFDGSIFLKNGVELLRKYGYTKYHRENVSIEKVCKLLKSKGLKEKEINLQLVKFRFKKSKGSTNSVVLPNNFDADLLKIAKFVRIRTGSISISKAYVESFNENYNELVSIIEQMFNISPKYTCKNEPIFCSGVLVDLFKFITQNKLIN